MDCQVDARRPQPRIRSTETNQAAQLGLDLDENVAPGQAIPMSGKGDSFDGGECWADSSDRVPNHFVVISKTCIAFAVAVQTTADLPEGVNLTRPESATNPSRSSSRRRGRSLLPFMLSSS